MLTTIVKEVNKGTGAGGANTNLYGKNFENKTNNQSRLLDTGYCKYSFTKKPKNINDFYLLNTFTPFRTEDAQPVHFCSLNSSHSVGVLNEKRCKKEKEEKKIIFVLQNGFKMYMKNKYNIDIFRCPDEAYIIEYINNENQIYKTVIKILEKKRQNVEGSVETKLWSGPSLKREYELVLGENFEVHYGFCVSDFLKKKLISNEKKYTIFNKILNEHNIDVLFGDDEDYFETLDNWLNKE